MQTSPESSPEPTVEEKAEAFVQTTFHDPEGFRYWQNRFDRNDMETAYCAGYAAGLAHALAKMEGRS